MPPFPMFHLKVWRVEQTCLFELSWGKGQQLSARLTYPNTLNNFYQTWQQNYLNFYKAALRARSPWSGVVVSPPVDWRAELVQAEAKFLSEFHYWLSSAELLEIRKQIAKAAAGKELQESGAVDIFLTCDSLELARLPWEAWEIGTEFAATKPIRIARTPANIRTESVPRKQQGKLRILVILGDETGLNFQADREAVQQLASLAKIEFVGWQQGQDPTTLKQRIGSAIADPQGWDILFFAGHSNETAITGGELAIAPGESLLVSEIAPQLSLAKDRGLQFAIFNSCNGLSIAQALINLGLSQVAVMREPIHNQVAQAFLVRFLQSLTTYQNVHDALLSVCQHLKLERHLTYPSAHLVPSLFRHPDSTLFQLQPSGWRQQIKQWLPTKREVIALSTVCLLSLLTPLQDYWLLQQRIRMQAVYRQLTQQTGTFFPPIRLVQIDNPSIQKAGISNSSPMPRDYLAKLVNQLSTLDARTIGIDYLLDRPQQTDAKLDQAIQAAIQQQSTWFVFITQEDPTGWLKTLPQIASPHWSLEGDSWIPFWRVRSLPPPGSTRPLPFSYLLATAYRLQTELPQTGIVPSPQPRLQSQQELWNQVQTYIRQIQSPSRKPFTTNRMRLHPITDLSYSWQHAWLQPILDFSVPPNQVYDVIPAWQLLQQPEAVLKARGLSSLRSQIVIVVSGEELFPLPPGVGYWRSQQNPPEANWVFTGGEAHAYMLHHFLTHHLVIPIPDLWIVLLAAFLGKSAGVLNTTCFRRWWLLLWCTTLIYGLVSLQLYITAEVLLPWLLPVATLWSYVLLQRRE